MDGFLVWVTPVLRGARLLGVFDAVSDDGGAAGAIARFDTIEHGRVQIVTVGFDGELGLDPDEPTALGRVEQIVEGPDEVRVRGTFGELRFAPDAGIDLLDLWSGPIDAERSLLHHADPQQRLIGSVLARPQTQVRVSRRANGGVATDIVLSARDRVAVAHDGAAGTVFVSTDLSMRTLELAGLLAHPTSLGDRPTATDPTGDLVVVQVISDAGGGMLNGGTFAWLECGRAGWVELLEDGHREAMPRTLVAADILAAMSTATSTATSGATVDG